MLLFLKNSLWRKLEVIFLGAEQGLCVRVVVRHLRALVPRIKAESPHGGRQGAGLQGTAVGPVQNDNGVH